MATISAPAASRSRPIGYQSWHDLVFVHWRVPAESLRPHVPPELTIDTWQGDAWIGLVAFHMSGIHPWWFPPLWYFSAFPEINVRTYVRCGAEEPGIWFFSLEASRLVAVLVARHHWQLNYHWARMRAERTPERASYRSRRIGGRPAAAHISVELECGDVPSQATPGTLEHFLVERYVYYNRTRRGTWQQGRVRHAPYPLLDARLIACEQSLVAAAGIEAAGGPCHVAFSPGVDVEIESVRGLIPERSFA